MIKKLSIMLLSLGCYKGVQATPINAQTIQAANTEASAELSTTPNTMNSVSLEAAQNPLSGHYSLPLKFTYHGDAPRGDVYTWSLQPIFPISLGENWNLINQLNLNFADVGGGITGIPELPNPYLNIKNPSAGYRDATGLADLNFTTLLSPVRHDGLSWGAGMTFTFPTDAPYRELGSGKFSLGPAFSVFKQTTQWTLGLETKQIFSITGSKGRADISQLQLKPFASYNLADDWYVFSNMIVVSNWHLPDNQRWTLPLGGGVGKVIDLDSHKINTRLESYYNVVRPDQAPDWTLGATVQWLFEP